MLYSLVVCHVSGLGFRVSVAVVVACAAMRQHRKNTVRVCEERTSSLIKLLSGGTAIAKLSGKASAPTPTPTSKQHS